MTVTSEDFAALLEASFQNIPERGDIVSGTILSIDNQGILVDVGMKSDGIVSRADLEKMEFIPDYQVGDTVPVMILREDSNGNMLVSISQAKQLEDWERAEELMDNEEAWEGKVVDANKGGLIVQFGHLRGFIPASHTTRLPRDLSEEDRRYQLKSMIGSSIVCKVIEVNRKRRRLVLSEREAQREYREQRKEILLEELNEGDIVPGVISGMRDFGAFVDLGGADGLIHISELAWHRVNHPREVVSTRQKLDVYVLRLDQETKRIELSLKRLQPNPWADIENRYHVGQLVTGTINRVADFGAFVLLEGGIEGLLHSNHMQSADQDPRSLLNEGQQVLLRVVSIEAEEQRIGLSLRDVTEEEWANWQAQQLEPSEDAEKSLELE